MAAEEAPRREEGPIFKDIRRYSCKYCGIVRSKKSLIESHIQSNHQEEREIEEMEGGEEKKDCENKCEECGMSFKKPAHLKQHMLCHSFERPFVCSVDGCQASFRRKYHLDRHLKQHQSKPFKCRIENCKGEFDVKSDLMSHMKEAHGSEPVPKDAKESKKYICEEIGCGKEFKYQSQLHSHELAHVKLGASSEAFCSHPDCMKPFSNLECLRALYKACHQYISCEVCRSKHLRKNMERHLRTHEEHPPEIIKCTFDGCDHTFTTKSNLQQHVKAAHLNLRPYVCSIPGCGMRFAYRHVRDNHEKSGRHVYVQGDLEEFDEQFTSRPRGGQKRKYPSVEMLTRKRVTPLNQCDRVQNQGPDYLSWLLSADG